jgi:hypothetical protein
MDHREYVSALRTLYLTPYSAAKTGVLGISLRQSMKYASGEQPVSRPVELLLLMYLRYGIWDGIKDYLKIGE